MLVVARVQLLAELDILRQGVFLVEFEAVQGQNHSVGLVAKRNKAEPLLRSMPAKVDVGLNAVRAVSFCASTKEHPQAKHAKKQMGNYKSSDPCPLRLETLV